MDRRWTAKEVAKLKEVFYKPSYLGFMYLGPIHREKIFRLARSKRPSFDE